MNSNERTLLRLWTVIRGIALRSGCALGLFVFGGVAVYGGLAWWGRASLRSALEEVRAAGMQIETALEPAIVDNRGLAAAGYLEAAGTLAKRAYHSVTHLSDASRAYYDAELGQALPESAFEALGRCCERTTLLRRLVEAGLASDEIFFKVQFPKFGVVELTQLPAEPYLLGHTMLLFGLYDQVADDTDAGLMWAAKIVRLAEVCGRIPHPEAFRVGYYGSVLKAKKILELLLSRGVAGQQALGEVQKALGEAKRNFSAALILRAEAALLARQAAHVPESVVVLRCVRTPETAPRLLHRHLPPLALRCYATALRGCAEAYRWAMKPVAEQWTWVTGLGWSEDFDPSVVQTPRGYDAELFAAAGFAYTAVKGRVILAVCETACAVERFRLEHGSWPDDLSELVPTFIDLIPQDPVDGATMGYERTSYGVVVYSRVVELQGDERLWLKTPAYRGHYRDFVFALLDEELRGKYIEHARGRGRFDRDQNAQQRE